jgi:hypothetical protein
MRPPLNTFERAVFTPTTAISVVDERGLELPADVAPVLARAGRRKRWKTL